MEVFYLFVTVLWETRGIVCLTEPFECYLFVIWFFIWNGISNRRLESTGGRASDPLKLGHARLLPGL